MLLTLEQGVVTSLSVVMLKVCHQITMTSSYNAELYQCMTGNTRKI